MMSGIILIADYFVQVTVIQQSLLSGETDGIALLTQFNPHGVFIALEEVSFLLLSIAFAFLTPVFKSKNGVERALRTTFISGFLLALGSLFIITVQYGIQREYIFEVAIISIVWLELIVASVLLSRFFKRTEFSV